MAMENGNVKDDEEEEEAAAKRDEEILKMICMVPASE